MAKILCIPLEQAKKLRQALVNGDINIKKFFTTKSSDIQKILEKYIDPNMAKFVNNEFTKVLKSNQDTAIDNWINENFRDKNDKEMAKKESRSINKLLTPDDSKQLEKLIGDKLGINVTNEEYTKITELANKMQEQWDEININNLDMASNPKEFLNFYETKDKLDKYIQGRAPVGLFQLYMKSISKVPMLFTISSPILNVIGNTGMITGSSLVRTTDIAVNAIMGKGITRGLNPEYAREFGKANKAIFDKTGYDTSRMNNIDDFNKVIGEKFVSAEGKGWARKFLKGYSNIVYHYALGKPDVFFASWAFTDRANYESSLIAVSEGLKGKQAKDRALEIFKDATKIFPSTPEGQLTRDIAKQDAEFYTFTNKDVFQNVSKNSRGVLNKLSGNLSLGDQIIPFANTPANAIQRLVDTTGVTAPYYLAKTIKAVKDGDKVALRKNLTPLYLAGWGWLAAWLLTQLLKPDDHIGPYEAYDINEKALVKAKNGIYNSIKIKDKWISLDYLPVIGLNIAILMNLKKGLNTKNYFKSFQTITSQVFSIPGVKEVAGIFNMTKLKTEKDWQYLADEQIRGANNFIISRIVPSIIGQVTSSIFDKYQRETRDKDVISGIGNEWIKKFAPNKLQPKIDMFDKIKPTSPINLLFGQRVRFAENNDLVNELNRLSQYSTLPNMKDIRYYNTKMKVLSNKMGKENYLQLYRDISSDIDKNWNRTIKSSQYLNSDDEGRRKLLNKKSKESIDRVINRNREAFRFIIKYKQDKKRQEYLKRTNKL